MFEQYKDDFINEDVFPHGKMFRIIFDNITAKFRLLAKHNEDLRKVVDAFSTDNNAAFFSAQYGYSVDTKNYSINKFGFFPIGLIFEVVNFIKREYSSSDCIAISKNVKQFIVDYLLPLKSFANNRNRETFKVSNISASLKMRPYQEEAIKSIIFDGFGRGLIELPTGSGKSFVIANFIYTLLQQFNSSLRTLILVPNKQLVEQFYKDLIEYGYKKDEVTKLTAGKPKKGEEYNSKAKIIVSNRQYLFNNSEKLPKIDVLIGDEAHTAAEQNSVTYKFIENLNCAIKVGCSGTLPRDNYRKWALIGLFSRIIYSEDIVDLQESGYLSKLQIEVMYITDEIVENDRNLLFNLHSNRKFDESGEIAFNDSYYEEVEYTNKNCMRLYKPMVEKISKMVGNVLVLFDRIEFGHELFDFVKSENPRNSNVFYIDGSTKIDDRESIRAEFEKTNNNIMIAQSSIMSTGVNIRQLSNLCFTGGGKSLTKSIQSIGRMLRLHESKTHATLLDCVFNFKYSRRHFSERMKLYREFYHKQKPDKIQKIKI